jgi:hypothetical protein
MQRDGTLPEEMRRGQRALHYRPDPPTAEAIGWAEPYNRRFPDPTITRLLKEAPDHSYMYLGGLPPS